MVTETAGRILMAVGLCGGALVLAWLCHELLSIMWELGGRRARFGGCLYVLCMIGVANVVASYFAWRVFGFEGSSVGGKIEGGRYWFGHRGNYTEVAAITYWLNYTHIVGSSVLGFGAGAACFSLILLARRNRRRRVLHDLDSEPGDDEHAQ